MKLNLSLLLKDADGEAIRRVEPDPKKAGETLDKGALELQHVLFAAVNSIYKGEESLSPEDTYIRGKLARKVKDKGEKNFSAEEITLLLRCVARRYMVDPLFALTISEILDPEKFKPADEKV